MTRTSTDGGFEGKLHETTQRVIAVFYEVYNELGYGFVESIYRSAMYLALHEAGLTVKMEVPIKVHFRKRVIGVFKADLIVDDSVLVELKTCARVSSKSINRRR